MLIAVGFGGIRGQGVKNPTSQALSDHLDFLLFPVVRSTDAGQFGNLFIGTKEKVT